jgi:hypothetical protein
MDLTAFHLGELQADRADQIREHLELCADCHQEIAQFNEFMRATTHTEPETKAGSNPVEILIAGLQNLGGSLAFAGVRGTGSDVPQVYAVGEMQVSITTEEMDGLTNRFRLTGLLLGVDREQWTAHLWNSEQLLGSNIVRDGEFYFEDLERGSYTLILDSSEDGPEREIHLQSIQV